MSIVVNAAYNIGGNGGRKLVRLKDGTLVSALINGSSGWKLFKSVDNGNSWVEMYSYDIKTQDLSLVVLDDDTIGVLYVRGPYYQTSFKRFKVSTNVREILVNIDNSSQTAIGNISLAVDPSTGHLHAAWSSKNSTYPNCFNIRYAKSTDGGVTWSAVEQVTHIANSAVQMNNPTIVVKNNSPLIIFDRYQSNGYQLQYVTPPTTIGGLWEGNAGTKYIYYGGAYAQTNASAVVDKDGTIHVAWCGKLGASSYDHILYSKSEDGKNTWATPINLTPSEKQNQLTPSITVDKNNKLIVTFYGIDPNVSTSAQIRKVTKVANTWSSISTITNSAIQKTNPSTLYDPTFSGQFNGDPPTIYQAVNIVEYIGSYTTNAAPVVNLTAPTNNQTLYENDVFNITGTALDANNGNTVTIRYQINTFTTRAIKAFLSDGSTLESFSKSLTFKNGNLYDGTTLIAENLSDGVAHTLKVWATDDQGGTSAIREIPFYVVPNRAPLLTVNVPVISGLINSDKFTIDGTFEDSDGNNTIVSYRLNGESSVQVAESVNGSFEFELSFGQLVIGANEIVIEAVDSYGAKVSKTVKLNKAAVETPLLKSTARYKVNPPTGSARGVLLWIQRDENLDIDVSISMTMQGEAESFVPLTVSNSAPLDQNSPIIEDEFYHEADGTKDNIILQIHMERTSLEVSDKIYLISGVLD